ncbi:MULTISPECIES: metallophosphoesterase family protein [unclassified Massilia]|uniref:metallophosphoesterase family protein n=1 Tax=unclassified Massilia TaxID=2609279 RepID=UPI001B831F18|nr:MULTISPECIES: metallophosphoesterase family protein [unclassified Massilia]MBQ5940155.1 metallophosphoesterase family protein [Massilia sp. AB1]MBQ5962995.1 metallophosphoesterase family protein [Massilia sp. ZL223]
MRVGLISDTHGLLRPQALDFLRGSAHILHAGDIVAPDILDRLAGIAPLTAVRGNNDRGAWAEGLPHTVRLDLGGVGIYMIHDLKELEGDPAADGVRVVVAGHSHKPACVEKHGVLYVNPGSAGPRRFSLPISVGELLIEGGSVQVNLVTLDLS